MQAADLDRPVARDAVHRLLTGYSIEVTSKDIAELDAAAPLLAPGTRTSVTSLPRETNAQLVAASKAVLDHGLQPVPHISARRIASAADLEVQLAALAEAGAGQELFIIAGDIDAPLGPYQDALSVIRSGLLSRYGVKRIGIGGYPEGHPKIADDLLWSAMAQKAAAVADIGAELSIVTQFGFDAGQALAWIHRVRDRGLAAPIRLGIPGPADAVTLLRFAARCGVGASRKVLAKYGLSLTRLMQPAGPDSHVRQIAEGLDASRGGAVSMHLFPFGGLERTARWIAANQPEIATPA
jgi:methylenetetrahydrofolate reductase (NADPH)